MNRSDLFELVREAVVQPRQSAARILAHPMGKSTLYEALFLVSILAVIGVYGVAMISGERLGEQALLPPPFALLALQIGAMLILSAAATVIGRVFGGTGDFRASLRILVWLQFLMVLLQLVQLVVLIILPGLSGILSLASLGLMGWIAVGLVAGLHQFRSLGLTFLGMLGGMIVVSIFMMFLLAPFLPAVS